MSVVFGCESLNVIRSLLLRFTETEESRFYELKTNRPLFHAKGARLIVNAEPWRLLDGNLSIDEDQNTVSYDTFKIGAQAIPELDHEYHRARMEDAGILRRFVDSVWPLEVAGCSREKLDNTLVS